jgi:hypothetical protein
MIMIRCGVREHGTYRAVDGALMCQPYVNSNTPDIADAEAMGEAVTRPTIRFVPIKAVAQQDL